LHRRDASFDTSRESVDEPAQNVKVRTSVAASTVTGGSQPVLSVSRIHVAEEGEQEETVRGGTE
jgi:hypothetical protein